MADTRSLFAPVATDLAAVERCLLESAEGQHPMLAEALRYVFDTNGKRLRPAMVLLSGALGSTISTASCSWRHRSKLCIPQVWCTTIR